MLRHSYTWQRWYHNAQPSVDVSVVSILVKFCSVEPDSTNQCTSEPAENQCQSNASSILRMILSTRYTEQTFFEFKMWQMIWSPGWLVIWHTDITSHNVLARTWLYGVVWAMLSIQNAVKGTLFWKVVFQTTFTNKEHIPKLFRNGRRKPLVAVVLKLLLIRWYWQPDEVVE